MATKPNKATSEYVLQLEQENARLKGLVTHTQECLDSAEKEAKSGMNKDINRLKKLLAAAFKRLPAEQIYDVLMEGL